MVVVDSMRFPYIEAGGTPGNPPTAGTNKLYSYQRLQPYRGGHAVPSTTGTGIDTRYGYTEQVAVPASLTGNYGQYGGTDAAHRITTQMYHTLGYPNDGSCTFSANPITNTTTVTQQEGWDYFAVQRSRFHERVRADAGSRLPAGPVHQAVRRVRAVAHQRDHHLHSRGGGYPDHARGHVAATPYTNATNPFNAVGGATTNPFQPHTFPYLVDKFFYTAAGATRGHAVVCQRPDGRRLVQDVRGL